MRHSTPQHFNISKLIIKRIKFALRHQKTKIDIVKPLTLIRIKYGELNGSSTPYETTKKLLGLGC